MQTSTRRYFYLTVGWLFCGLGFLGAFLPILPTVPFLLVAVWAFSKSSPRLKKWLMTHPRFGPALSDWFEKGAISKPAKFAAVSLMTVSVGISAYLSENVYVPIILGGVLVCVAVYILTRPSPQRLP